MIRCQIFETEFILFHEMTLRGLYIHVFKCCQQLVKRSSFNVLQNESEGGRA